MTDNLDRLRELLGVVSDIGHAAAVLNWDQQTYMPRGGAGARAMQLATLSRLAHEHFVSAELQETLEKAKGEVVNLDPDSRDARLVKVTERELRKRVKVPSAWVEEHSRVTAMAHQDWEQARKDAQFSLFAPHLEKILALKREYANFFAPFDHIYDPLLEDYEPGMKAADLQPVFARLRERQVPLIQAIMESGVTVDDAPVRMEFEEQKQWDFGVEVIKAFGYDFSRGRQDKAVHPFSTGFGTGDVRITTRFDTHFLNPALFGTMHEAGHAMYEQGVDPQLERSILEGGASLGMHESQSRMWENLVGRSRPFWTAFYPRLQKTFPAQTADVDLDGFYAAINKVGRTFIRVDADEATYNLHIMLRFELEMALLAGELAVNDLPQAWDDKFETFFGVRPPDDAQGVLQDVHWSAGYIGYFPTYSLGNLIAAQLWEKIHVDIPDLEAQIEQAKFSDLLAWLRENIHQHGATFEPLELLERVVGTGLDVEPYLKYLETKFSEIYSLA
ncbi:MAG: carboxypeptidase M32 [Anaerolineales bacterium]|nr:MAG: carboxypeptidase M32 [Anaerolineales bacterium]